MSTITATITYRTYIPWGWIAIPFCRVEFMGSDNKLIEQLEDKWHDVEFEKYHEMDNLIKGLKTNIELLSSQIEQLETEYKQSKKWYRFANKKERQLKKEIENKQASIFQINGQIKKYDNDRFYDATELRTKATRFLSDNKFVLMNKSSAGDECVTHTEIWHKTVL
jgi:archaellum component FlaC